MKNFILVGIASFIFVGCASLQDESRYYLDAEEVIYITDQGIQWLVRDSIKSSSLLIEDASMLKPGSFTFVLSPNFILGSVIDDRKKVSFYSSAANTYLNGHKKIKNCGVEKILSTDHSESDYTGYIFFYSC